MWHYTDANGLLGILRNEELWASDVDYLNDVSERSFGESALIEALEKEIDRLGGHQADNGRALEAWDMWVWTEALRGHLYDPDTPDLPRAFAVSLCETGDLLSQWRGYAGGSGFALRFEFGATSPIHETGVEIRRVSYGKGAVARYRQEIRARWDAHASTDGKGTLTPEDIAELLRIAATHKDSSFYEEDETRLLLVAPNEDLVKVRASSTRLVPYVPVPIDLSEVKEVMVGPFPDRYLQGKAVETELVNLGCNADVSISTSPFRL